MEHDACGIGFIADLKNVKSHSIIERGIEILENLEHRGAVGAEANSGDGAGLLIQTPHPFFQEVCSENDISLPDEGEYGAGIAFLPHDKDDREKLKSIFTASAEKFGLKTLGWRKVPTDNATLGSMVIDVEPVMEQIFIGWAGEPGDQDSLDRKLFVVRKHAKHQSQASGIAGAKDYYVASLSSKIICYKGMLTPWQVKHYFPDLRDKRMTSALALVHSRFSTNTFPTWPLAQPFRYIAHNGEINTLRGNVNWMRTRQSLFKSDLFTDEEIEALLPIIDDTQSDSAITDNAIELLTLSGRSLPHVMMMMIPEVWGDGHDESEYKRALYEYHATIMEPWDGPASIAFTDGKIIGATLDRNGLRPSRYCLTRDNILIMGSEAGVLEIDPGEIVLKGRLQPGRMFVADLEEGRIIPDDEIKKSISDRRPYKEWLDRNKLSLGELTHVPSPHQPDHKTLTHRQATFGYTMEDLGIIIEPMATGAAEPIGSMGNDTPVAALSDHPQPLFNYFYQLFAQVTNPPIDPIREKSVMSLFSFIGAQLNMLDETEHHCRVIEVPQPVLTNDELERLRCIDKKGFRAVTIQTLFNAKVKGDLPKAVDRICAEAEKSVDEGANILILSDRGVKRGLAPIPPLLAQSAVHHHLIRAGKRTMCGMVVETGGAREVHHFALLLGYGANAVNPFVAFETVEDMRLCGELSQNITCAKARENYISAVGKGLLKIMSKMGISTLQSYMGAQIFEAVGLSEDMVEKYFTGTISRLGGIGVDVLEEESLRRHRYAFPSDDEAGEVQIEPGGQYSWRARGERHSYNPESIQLLQQSTSSNDYKLFKKYTELINLHPEELYTIRGVLDFTDDSSPIDIEEVEPVDAIVKRFFTGAMSFGSISREAHETLAIAMNRLGGRSNCGEGGEDPERFVTMENGDSRRSAIKQVASGRFGVTSNYLVNADELQIKMAQGAKPGEGGHLPGSKVNKIIAKVRHSTPGVGLISPPPHHDIYSIEDLAQLIYDLKNSNNRARINVKLVSETGVGTIAAGVSKGHAEAVLISGHDGGTGASPQSSIKHAGLPWEIGLAETHQILMHNLLRSRIVVQTDGRIATGRDVAIATLLGAEEWGSATAALVVCGCVMMRKCHLNSCPVGVATQDPELRKNYTGSPDHVVNFFTFMAMEMREYMARFGFRTVNEMVGRVDKLKLKEGITHWKAKHLKVDKLLYKEEAGGHPSHQCEPQDFGLASALDNKLIEIARPALDKGEKVRGEFKIRNINRTVGTLLSAEVSRAYGEDGLPEDSICFKVTGSAGQSFSAFGAKGITFELEGETNDYFCKGLSGAKVILYPPKESTFKAHENVICGNVAFYGATSGEAYIHGLAGERFCVRNSGAEVVVEAVGDHGCEYMTGGRVVILGAIGKNFAAGMSGGIAYILDKDGSAQSRINTSMVELERLDVPAEAEYLKKMIARHYEYTKSPIAGDTLDRWDEISPSFIKVMPTDYKRALREAENESKAETEQAVTTG
ncbi:Glutamate synthase [NADPH] large chain [hydrothermal vent metagenome]|uniref:Glutamate synthase [NADPH] large chain n=1 Tax=hydrothermal vent metagenome TaxID=652676 RepID=A0A3B1BH12_9ZZZZ